MIGVIHFNDKHCWSCEYWTNYEDDNCQIGECVVNPPVIVEKLLKPAKKGNPTRAEIAKATKYPSTSRDCIACSSYVHNGYCIERG